MKLVDFATIRKGKVIVINKEYRRTDDNKIIMLCKCDCGTIFEVKRTTFLSDGFKGHCGCEKHRNHRDCRLQPLHRRVSSITNTEELSEYDLKMLKLKEVCLDIRQYFVNLHSGKINGKINGKI